MSQAWDVGEARRPVNEGRGTPRTFSLWSSHRDADNVSRLRKADARRTDPSLTFKNYPEHTLEEDLFQDLPGTHPDMRLAKLAPTHAHPHLLGSNMRRSNDHAHGCLDMVGKKVCVVVCVCSIDLQVL